MENRENCWLLKEWTVFPKLNLIQNHQSELVLKPRLMKLLEYFLLHQNEVVTREAILEYVWEGRIVTENLLTKSISELRKLLETHFQDELNIETIRNVGYRFQVNFDIVSGTSPVPKSQAGKVARNSLALPLALVLSACLLIVLFVFFSYRSDTDYSTNLSLVSSLKGQELSPVISPDGRNIAFTWRKSTTKPFHIFVRSLAESTPRKLTQHDGPEYNPAWSPDGRSLALMRQDSARGWLLVEKSIMGDDEVELAELNDLGAARGLIWSAREDLLIFPAKGPKDNAYRLYAYDFEKAAIRPITSPADSIYGDLHPAHCKDRNEIAFVRASYGKSILSDVAPTQCAILKVDLSTLETQMIAQFEREVKELVYHPELQQHLCWVFQQLGHNELWSVDSKGDMNHLQTFQRGLPGKGAVGDDDTFYFEYWQSSVNVLRYTLESDTALHTGSMEYLNSTQWDWGLRFARNTRKMAFISMRDGFQEIWVAPPDNPEAATKVTDLKSALIKSLSLSPDGQKVLFLTIEEDQPVIRLIQTNGQNLQQLTHDHFDYSSPEWAADGQSFYYGSNKSGTWQLWERDLKGTMDRQITTRGGHTALLHPTDPDRLYFIKTAADTIWQHNATTGLTSPLCVTAGMETFNWTPQQNGIYFLEWQNGICQLKYFEYTTQQTHAIQPLEDILPGIPALSMPPEGKAIFVAQADEINADIYAIKIGM